MPYRLGAALRPDANSGDGDRRFDRFHELGLEDDFLPIHIDHNSSRTDESMERHEAVKKIGFDHVEDGVNFIDNDWRVWEILRCVGVRCLAIL